MPRKKKQVPGLVAELMNQECGRLDDAMLDVRIATVDFVRHCVEILGKKGDVTFKPVALWNSSEMVEVVHATDKGDVLVYNTNLVAQHLDDLPLDDAVQIAKILNAIVQMKPEKPRKSKTVKKRMPRTRIDPVTFESRMRGEQ